MKMFHKGLAFTPKQLGLYLKGVKSWGKKEYEIAVSLICLKNYREIVPGKYFVTFPPKLSYMGEFSLNYVLSTSRLKDILYKNWEENTDIDTAIFRKNNKGELFKILLQIKRFGLGREARENSNGFIDFLNKLKKRSPITESRLIILREKISGLRPQKIVEWLNNNEFPFPEVVLIHQKPNMDMELYQLKPNNGTFSFKTLTKSQIMDIY